MKEWDPTGRKLAEAQGRLFEESLTAFSGSSAVFIRRFLTSKVAHSFDDGSILLSPSGMSYAELDLPKDNGAPRGNGQLRYSANALHWLGYLYRYWAYTRELSSAQLLQLCPSKRLVSLYLPYHTQDVEAALRSIEENLPNSSPSDLNALLLEGYRSASRKGKRD
jgi:hypothetical protein